jgi:hypothetical protein
MDSRTHLREKVVPCLSIRPLGGAGGHRYRAPQILTFSSRGRLLKNYTIRSLWTENKPLVFGMLDSKRQSQSGITPLLGHLCAVQVILNLGRSVQLKFYLSIMFVWRIIRTLARCSYVYRNLVVGDIAPAGISSPSFHSSTLSTSGRYTNVGDNPALISILVGLHWGFKTWSKSCAGGSGSVILKLNALWHWVTYIKPTSFLSEFCTLYID